MRALLPLSTLTLLALSSSAAHAVEPWRGDVVDDLWPTEAVGDFDGDSVADRVVGLPAYEGDKGMVAIFFGTGIPGDHLAAAGGSGTRYADLDAAFDDAHVMRIELDSAWFSGTGVNSITPAQLGAALVVGDFDHDGADDLAVGLPGAKISNRLGAGAVAVFYGADLAAKRADDVNGVTAPSPYRGQLWTQDTPGIEDQAETGDRFGRVLAAGDLDCNGGDDLVVGVPDESFDKGVVHVIYGGWGGLTADWDGYVHQDTAGISETAESGDHFGAALAVGQFSDAAYFGRRGTVLERYCPSLAIGAPGEDLTSGGVSQDGAGLVHVLLSADQVAGGYAAPPVLAAGGEGLLHQDVAGVPSDPEAGDLFGATLGTRSQADGWESLWIGIPGETGWSEDDDGAVVIFSGEPNGITGTVSMEPMQLRPDVAETELGRWVQVQDDLGRWYQYLPATQPLDETELFVISHGTNSADWDLDGVVEGDALTPAMGGAAMYAQFAAWTEVAEAKNMALIVPQYEDWNFGNRNTDGLSELAGYRGLDGRDMRADLWVLRILERYNQAGIGDSDITMFGHSAGAQFTNRFFAMHPDRVENIIIESAKNYTFPEDPATAYADLVPWHSGFGQRTTSSGWQPWLFQPDLTDFLDRAGDVTIRIVLAEFDSAEHFADAATYKAAVEAFSDGVVPICTVLGAQHSASQEHRDALVGLWPELESDPATPSLAGYTDCVP